MIFKRGLYELSIITNPNGDACFEISDPKKNSMFVTIKSEDVHTIALELTSEAMIKADLWDEHVSNLAEHGGG